MTVEEAKEKECCQLEGRCQADKGGLVMEERKIESLDEAIDELLSLGYLQYVEPEGCSVEVTEADLRIGLETQNIGKKECCVQGEE